MCASWTWCSGSTRCASGLGEAGGNYALRWCACGRFQGGVCAVRAGHFAFWLPRGAEAACDLGSRSQWARNGAAGCGWLLLGFARLQTAGCRRCRPAASEEFEAAHHIVCSCGFVAVACEARLLGLAVAGVLHPGRVHHWRRNPGDLQEGVRANLLLPVGLALLGALLLLLLLLPLLAALLCYRRRYRPTCYPPPRNPPLPTLAAAAAGRPGAAQRAGCPRNLRCSGPAGCSSSIAEAWLGAVTVSLRPACCSRGSCGHAAAGGCGHAAAGRRYTSCFTAGQRGQRAAACLSAPLSFCCWASPGPDAPAPHLA